MKHIFRNWKTSLLGLVAAAPSIAEALATGNKATIIQSIGIILLGLVAKDGDVSGLPQTK